MKNVIVVLSILLLAACGGTPTPPAASYSGYMIHYEQLKPIKTTDDSMALRYINDELAARKYTKVIVDPISYYPAPKTSDTIPSATLKDISTYVNTSIPMALKNHFTIVDKPGENTLRLRMAITGVSIGDRELAGYEYIPIAFLVTAAKGGLSDMTATLQIEAELVDSLTSERLAAVVKQGKGETLDNDKTALTLPKVKPLIDTWIKTMDATLSEELSK